MTFWGFVVNYFSPFYFAARCFFAFWAAMSWFVLGYFVAAMTQYDDKVCVIIFRGLAIILMWNALRPWGKGTNLMQINKKLDNLNNKYK